MQLDNSIIVATERFVEGCVVSVSNNQQLVLAAENLKGIKEKYKEIEDMRKSMTIPLDASKKAIMDFFRKPLSLLENVEGKLKETILNFQCEQQRLAEIAQEKLRIAALKKEEETRRKLADLAEAQELKGIKEKYKEIEEMRKSMTIPLDASKKAIMDFFRKPLSLLENAEGKLKATILNFQCEQQRLAEIAQEKLRIAALKKEEETRRKLADLADAQELKGNVVTAEALRAQAMEVSVEVPIVLADVQKIAGISTRETWSFEVVDPCIVPRQFLIVDEKSLGKIAIATKGTFPVSGVRFFSKQSMSVGTNHG